MNPLPPFDHVRRDLIAHLYGLAHVLDRCIRPGAGGSMLNLPAPIGELGFPKYDAFDLNSFPMAWGLRSVYRYAALGETSRYSAAALSTDPDEGALGRMQVLVDTFADESEVSYCLHEVVHAFDEPARPRGGFKEMVTRATARRHLDEGLELSPAQVALLAAVSERTVANAMSSSGDDALIASRTLDGRPAIKAADAERWLGGRRAFLKTVVVSKTNELPDAMTAEELGNYVRTIIVNHVSDEARDVASLASRGPHHLPGQRLAKMCGLLGWSEERVQAWVDGRVDDIDPGDCDVMAGFLGIDSRWLARQVLHVRAPVIDRQVEATLTDAGIRHGYFDIGQRFARQLFPDDSFGGRGADELGVPVRLHIDGELHETDIRIKSQALVSPRKRFSAYFKAHRAQPGDRVRVTKVGGRDFEVKFVPCRPDPADKTEKGADPQDQAS